MKDFQKKYPEVIFIIKFLLLFLFIYYGFELLIGITSPGNFYAPFVDQHLNLIKWYRVSILKSASFLSNILGYKAHLLSSTKLEGYNGYRVNMIYSCMGYGILSFWISFVINYPNSTILKLKWLFSGVILLWFVNVLRVLMLLLSINKSQNVHSFSKHHLVYNISTYIIIFILIFFFTKKKTNKK